MGYRMSNVTMTGPIFSPNVESQTKEEIRAIERELAKEGIGMVREQLHPGHGYVSGDFRRSITASRKTLNTTIYPRLWVIGLWLEGVGSRNDTTRFKGYAIFRKAREVLARESDDIAQRGVAKLVKKLNG